MFTKSSYVWPVSKQEKEQSAASIRTETTGISVEDTTVSTTVQALFLSIFVFTYLWNEY